MAISGELYREIRDIMPVSREGKTHTDCFDGDIATLTDGVIVIISN